MKRGEAKSQEKSLAGSGLAPLPVEGRTAVRSPPDNYCCCKGRCSDIRHRCVQEERGRWGESLPRMNGVDGIDRMTW